MNVGDKVRISEGFATSKSHGDVMDYALGCVGVIDRMTFDGDFRVALEPTEEWCTGFEQTVSGEYLTRVTLAASPDEQDIENAGGSDPLPDNVNHPSHYTSDPSGVECITITRHRNFNVGNAIKYLWRAGLKAEADKGAREKHIEDLKKSVFYIHDEIARLEQQA